MTSRIESDTALYNALQRDLRAARTRAQIEAVARRMDTDEFNALHRRIREDLRDLYVRQLRAIIGAMAP